MHKAVFEGLVVDENGNPAEVATLGGEPYYVVTDAGFERHVPAAQIDLQVLQTMKEQILSQRDSVVEAMLQYLGQDDLFTKATVETSIDQMDENLEQLQQVGLPEEARTWLGMMGFRIVIDVHGEIVDLEMPGTIEEE